jgi:hypothetical protein
VGFALLWPRGAAADHEQDETLAPAGCEPRQVTELLFDLFPPAPERLRVASARRLAACRIPRSAGPLGAALEGEEESQVRREVVSALGAIGTEDSRRILESFSARSAPPADRVEAIRVLVAGGKYEAAWGRIFDPNEDGALRAETLWLFEKAGAGPTGQALMHLTRDRDPAVGAAAAAILQRRRAAERDASSAPWRELPLAPSRNAEDLPSSSTRPNDPSLTSDAPRTLAEDHPSPPVVPPLPPSQPQTDARAAASSGPERPDPLPEEERARDPSAQVFTTPSTDAIPGAPEAGTPAPAVGLRLRAPSLLEAPPRGPPDGTALAIASSTMAGASLMSFLSLLADQGDPGVILLVGSAGAVIGGGTAWGLTRFGFTPTVDQAAWYSNVAAWGVLSGFLTSSAAGAESGKLRWGLAVGGETLGLSLGILTAHRYRFTAAQMVQSNSLVLGTGLSLLGVERLQGKPLVVSPLLAVAAVPAMIASSVATRYLEPSTEDLFLIGTAAASLGWTGSLLASGHFAEPLLISPRSQGGLAAGLGVGYLGATLAGAFSEVPRRSSLLGGGGLLAGNLIGLGTHMVLDPDRASVWSLGAGLGGAAFFTAAFGLAPYFDPGPAVLSMALTGAAYGAGTWWIASVAGHRTGDPVLEAHRLQLMGGMLAGGTASAVAGILASQAFAPTFGDQVETAAITGLGLSAGLGAARLAFETQGTADRLGVLLGTALGFGAGATVTRSVNLSGADVFAGLAGAGYGAYLGSLAPTLHLPEWNDGRSTSGGRLLGLAAGAFGAATAAHLAGATGAQVAVPAVAGLLGMGMGRGAGLMLPGEADQSVRIGTVAGTSALAAASLLLDRPLGLSKGLGRRAPSLMEFGGLWGAAGGWMLAGAIEPAGLLSLSDRQLRGGLLFGVSAGVTTGAVLSKFVEPRDTDYALSFATGVLGTGLGLGIPLLVKDTHGPWDSAGALAGSLVGLAAGGSVARHVTFKGAALPAGLIGLGYGAFLGTLAPTLNAGEWDGGRRAAGGALLGMALGSAGAATAAHVTEASGAEVAVPANAGILGAGIGLGAGLLSPSPTLQAARIGAFAGTGVLAGASILVDPVLHLSEGLGPSAPGLSIVGAAIGAGHGLLLAGAVGPSGLISGAGSRQVQGGMLLGAATGTTTGMVLSKFFRPTNQDLAFATAGSSVGMIFGLGLPMLAVASPGRHDTLGMLSGGLGGLVGGAAMARETALRGTDVSAGVIGLLYGGLVGTLAPTLREQSWDGGRKAAGGALLGMSMGASLATTATHFTDATPAELGVPAIAGLLGLGAGAGLGLLLPTPSLQPARIGTVIGIGSFIGGSLLAEPSLHLSEGLGSSAGALAALGSMIGGTQGVLLAGTVNPSGLLETTPGRQRFGGALLGSALGLSSGLVLSRFYSVGGDDVAIALAATALGGALGRGTAMITAPDAGRLDTALTLGGTMGGLLAAAAVQQFSPLTREDGYAIPVGLGYGALLGALAPSLRDEELVPGRRMTGWGIAGSAAGAIGAVALRHATSASGETVGLAALGGATGALGGLGAGMLFDGPGTQPQRIGLTLGTAAGLGIGMAAWPRLTLGAGDGHFIAAGTLVSAWTGAWLPALGHERLSDVSGVKHVGGLLAGASLGAFASSLIAEAVEVDPAVTLNTLGVAAIFSGAGAGAGALASTRDDAPILGMLGGGATGLLLGGLRSATIDLDRQSAPLALLSIGEGLWFGGFAPTLLYGADASARHRLGGFSAGTLGALGLTAILNRRLTISSRDAGVTGLSTLLGASMAGGMALTSTSLSGRAATGVMLSGSAVGLGAGLLWGPSLDFGDHALRAGALGALLGTSEALTFAWAAKAHESSTWAGMALFGAGAGTTLGLAAAAYPRFTLAQAPAAASFAAWGAWMGSFSGALVNRDPHEVTFGGLLGANAGFLVGYGLLRSEAMEARDLGWLSAFGAIGTVLGAGVGAPFSTRDNPNPVLAGLAVGPAVGMIAGALALPRLRTLGGSPSALRESRARRESEPASAELVEDEGPLEQLRVGRAVRDFVAVADWSPVVGAMPGGLASADAPLMQVGVTGRLW